MYEDRIESDVLRKKIISAAQAADMIKSGMTLGMSGFTGVGYPKAVPLAVAEQGTAKDLTVICGASVGDELDGALARAGLMARRYPFQSHKDVRKGINDGSILFDDIHLGHLPGILRSGVLGKIDMAVIACCRIMSDGSFIPTLAASITDTLALCAERVILEVDLTCPAELTGLHDISSVDGVSAELPVFRPSDRVGAVSVACDPEKIAGIVLSDIEGKSPVFTKPDDASAMIAGRILDLLDSEVKAGRIPEHFCIQSGVGSVANAVLDGLLSCKTHGLSMYTEVMQDGALHLVDRGVVSEASATSLSLSKEGRALFLSRLDYFKEHIVLRPQDISNHGNLIRRMGVVAMNTAVEADIYGHVNSTHIMGSNIINGIGGSADYARNAALSIFMTPSVAKDGDISCIVPMVTHVDNTEHDVQILVTEQGLADLRGLAPKERAERIIECCCHPMYHDALRAYYDRACSLCHGSQSPHDLANAFSWHLRYQQTGCMRGE